MNKSKWTTGLIAAILAAKLTLIPGVTVFAASTGADAKWINSTVAGRVTEKTPYNIKDDFALAANRDFAISAKIPEGKTIVGQGLHQNDDVANEQLKKLIHNPNLEGSDADMVNAVADIVGNWDARNKAGIQPLMRYVTEVSKLNTLEDIEKFLQDTERSSFGYGLPGISVLQAPDYPEYQTLNLDLLFSLVDFGDDYEKESAWGQLVIANKKETAIYMLERTGFSAEEAEKIFAQDLAFEHMLAPYMYTRKDVAQNNYSARCNNSYTGEQLRELAGNYPLMEILSAWGLGDGAAYLVLNPVYIKALSNVWTKQNADCIRSYLLVQYLIKNVKNVDRQAYDFANEQERKIFTSTGSISDEDLLLKDVKKFAGDALESLYIKAYGSEESKEEIQQICRDVIAYYRTLLENETWLSDETKAAAIDKLDQMNVFACYPDQTADFSRYDISDCKDLIALKRVLDRELVHDIQRSITAKIDRNKWGQPGLVYEGNAFYEPYSNSIYIVNGALGGDIYQKDWSYEQKLGGIGTLIGHEISHAFDSDGSQYDSQGTLRNWWTQEDAAEYKARVQKLVDYYDAMTPDVINQPYSGQQVDGEALADMTGMKAMLGIAATKEDFDYDLFFRQYAKVWNVIMTKEEMMYRFVDDPHPLNYLRINCTVQQFDEFMKTYDIKPGDGMYLAPEDRVLVW